jgi:lipopolysaccharide export system permease protein
VKILWRHLASEYLRVAAATLVGLVAVFLMVDYVDRSKIYTGPGWLMAVLELYACKAVMVGHQLAPAALLLAAGVVLARLQRSGEYTAMRALAIGPARVVAPLAMVCMLAVGGMMLADEHVVGPASLRADQITTGRFKLK